MHTIGDGSSTHKRTKRLLAGVLVYWMREAPGNVENFLQSKETTTGPDGTFTVAAAHSWLPFTSASISFVFLYAHGYRTAHGALRLGKEDSSAEVTSFELRPVTSVEERKRSLPTAG